MVVKSLDSSLRPECPSQHGINRHHQQEVEGREERSHLGCQCCFPLSRRRKNQTVPSLALSRRKGRRSGVNAANSDGLRGSFASGSCLRRHFQPTSLRLQLVLGFASIRMFRRILM
jgi:hypothetical protein